MKKATEFEKKQINRLEEVAVGKREEAVMEGILEFNKKCDEKDLSIHAFPYDFVGEGHNIKEAMNKYWNYIQGKSIVFKDVVDCQTLGPPNKDTEIKVEEK